MTTERGQASETQAYCLACMWGLTQGRKTATYLTFPKPSTEAEEEERLGKES